MCLLSERDGPGAADTGYDLALSAWGEGTLTEKGLLEFQKPEALLRAFKKRRRRAPRDVSLLVEDPLACGFGFSFTGVDAALLARFDTLKELILPASVVSLAVTPELEAVFRKNDTLIRGPFGSFAERFAAEQGLRFRPADLVFAESYFAPAQESTRLTLVFRRSGDVQIREDVSTPGSSPSHTLGGSFTYPLPRDFAETMRAEEAARALRPPLFSAAIADGRLAAFLEAAKTHPYYKGKV
ncbi:MAG: hypothetical protein IJR89_07140 [Clostridia bacterium]|nr:hypothetical protein [Clostridia bacterium]